MELKIRKQKLAKFISLLERAQVYGLSSLEKNQFDNLFLNFKTQIEADNNKEVHKGISNKYKQNKLFNT